MIRLTLEQAAEQYSELNGRFGQMEPIGSAFEAGAKWQKEQDKDVFNTLKELYNAIDSCVELTPALLFNAKNVIDKFN